MKQTKTNLRKLDQYFQILRNILVLSALCIGNAHAEIPKNWTTPIPPYQIADNIYYVGSQDLASYLITTSKGNILVNANLDTSPPQIRASVEKLGYRWSDIKILLNSQAHYDHVGGAAQVIQETNAQNYVMEGDNLVVESGGKTDFLLPSESVHFFTPARVGRVLHDLDSIQLGDVTIIAHKTPGHTRGCTTFSFLSHVPGEPKNQQREIVIVGGVSFWSEYHFVEKATQHESYPGIADDFYKTFSVLQSIPGEVFLGAHGVYFDMLEKLKKYPIQGASVFIDPIGYRDFIKDWQKNFQDALREQKQNN